MRLMSYRPAYGRLAVQFTDIDGVTLHFAHRPVAGRRHLVFINALGTDFRIWNAVTEVLGDDVSTLVYDKRGHGLSDLGTTPYSIEDHVDDLAELIDRLGIEDVALCGLSVGGLVAQGLYARRPELVSGLVLCDTAHKIGTQESWNARIATVKKDGIEAIADAVMKAWFTPGFHAQRTNELAGCRNMLVRQNVDGYIATCVALREADYTGVAASIAVPTLCVAGDQDGSTPPDLVRSLADLIAGSRFEVIADAGHIPCIERPEALAALLHAFLADLPAGN